jgi:hypothetical protein
MLSVILFRPYSVIEIIAALAGIPGLMDCHQLRCIPSLGAITIDIVSTSRPVEGPESLEYFAVDGLGRTVANSAKRGFGMRFDPDHSIVDPLLGPLSADLQTGIRRVCWMPTTGLSEVSGGLLPPSTNVVLSLWVPPSTATYLAQADLGGAATKTRRNRRASRDRS